MSTHRGLLDSEFWALLDTISRHVYHNKTEVYAIIPASKINYLDKEAYPH
jgi:hypothetical protein